LRPVAWAKTLLKISPAVGPGPGAQRHDVCLPRGQDQQPGAGRADHQRQMPPLGRHRPGGMPADLVVLRLRGRRGW
jgi:hypothetical protein